MSSSKITLSDFLDASGIGADATPYQVGQSYARGNVPAAYSPYHGMELCAEEFLRGYKDQIQNRAQASAR